MQEQSPKLETIMYEDNLPTKSEIFEHWKSRLSQLGFLIDWGEPECWACGFHYRSKFDIKRSDASWQTILALWNKIPLQRCHIVPRSLHGTDSVDNLFLMCRECHDTMPNTNIPAIFFEWARAQSWQAREHSKICNAFKAFGIAETDYERCRDVMDSKEFKTWIEGKLGIHRPQSNYAPTSSRLTPATMIGLVVHYIRETQVDAARQSI